MSARLLHRHRRRAPAAARPGRAITAARERVEPSTGPAPLAVFAARATARAAQWAAGELELCDAADACQRVAEALGLTIEPGQDAVQAVMATAFGAVRGAHTEELPEPEPAAEAEPPDDEDTFARACRTADEKARRNPPDPHIERARRMLADDVSLARACRQMHADFFHGRAAARTIMAAEYLIQQNNAEQFRTWLERHSAAERAEIQKHIREAKQCR